MKISYIVLGIAASAAAMTVKPRDTPSTTDTATPSTTTDDPNVLTFMAELLPAEALERRTVIAPTDHGPSGHPPRLQEAYIRIPLPTEQAGAVRPEAKTRDDGMDARKNEKRVDRLPWHSPTFTDA